MEMYENPASGATLTILTKPIAPFAVALQPVTQSAAAEDPGLPLELPIQVGSASANLHYYISIVPIPHSLDRTYGERWGFA